METIDIPIADMRYFDINVLKGYFSFIASHLLYLHFPKQINASFGDGLHKEETLLYFVIPFHSNSIQ